MKLFDFFFAGAIERRTAAFQNDLITRHCDEVDHIYRKMRAWRHDYHNHIQTLLALTEDPEALRKYLWELNDDLTTVDTVLKTGNVMVDAILNSKLSLIKSKQIAVNATAAVPAALGISEVDLCAILGNLLDNAMEACLRQEKAEARFIRVYIGVLKRQLYICVTNSTQGRPEKIGRTYRSAKTGEDHGLGLLRIDRLAEKYGGYVNRQSEEGAFATEVMLPMES